MKLNRHKIKNLISRLMKTKETSPTIEAGERPVKETSPDGAVCVTKRN